MNWEALGALAELLGAVGVIVTLVYLARQIRQSTRATRLATSQAIAAALSEWSRPLIEDPDLCRVFFAGVEDVTSLQDDERTRFFMLCYTYLRMFEEMHHQFRRGSLESEVWDGYARNYGLYAKAPGMQIYWKARREYFNPAFRDFVESYEPAPMPRLERVVNELGPQ